MTMILSSSAERKGDLTEWILLILQPKNPGERIDRFLSKDLETLSRSYLQKLLKDGEISVNGKPCESKL